jgi:uncharacterized membrane protein YkvI
MPQTHQYLSPSSISSSIKLEDRRTPRWYSSFALIIWLVSIVAVFLPFAVGTSPFDAVTLRVPGNQGNWWHALVGAPFFLAFPMVWLRLRALFSNRLSTPAGRRVLWIVAALSVFGTIAVETPFLLHLAGTSEWQRLAVLTLGFGIVIVSGILLYLRRRSMPPTSACLAALNAAYLANAALCLVVYSDAPDPFSAKTGWYVTVVLFWPILAELIWLLVHARHTLAPAE